MRKDISVVDIEQIIAVAVEAGEAIMKVYSREFTVEMKEDKSPLTEADREAHHIIAEALAKLTPEIPVLSEEGRAMAYEERKGWETLWVVDPLDGTKEFIKKNGEFTVNIALVERGVPVLGVVYAPALERCYFADGNGAFRREKGNTVRLPAEGTERPFTVVASRSHRSPETDELIEGLKGEHPELELTSIGSSLKLCLVAEGSADVYPRLAPTMEWDTAAARA